MKKVINRSEVVPGRSKLIIHRETIATLAAVRLNGVASGMRLAAAASGTTESVDFACDTTVSTQTH